MPKDSLSIIDNRTGESYELPVADGTIIMLRLDSEVGIPVGSIKVKSTGALDKWETQSCKITGARGVHDLYLKFFGTAAPLMNVDWWKFE